MDSSRFPLGSQRASPCRGRFRAEENSPPAQTWPLLVVIRAWTAPLTVGPAKESKSGSPARHWPGAHRCNPDGGEVRAACRGAGLDPVQPRRRIAHVGQGQFSVRCVGNPGFRTVDTPPLVGDGEVAGELGSKNHGVQHTGGEVVGDAFGPGRFEVSDFVQNPREPGTCGAVHVAEIAGDEKVPVLFQGNVVHITVPARIGEAGAGIEGWIEATVGQQLGEAGMRDGSGGVG